mgnify:CR=1 FL=1
MARLIWYYKDVKDWCVVLESIHRIILPSKVIIGPGAIKSIGEIVNEVAGRSKNIGVVTGENTYRIGGRIVEEYLGGHSKVETWIAGDASISTAEKISLKARENNIGLVIGVGGGRVIDVAKYIAFKNNIDVVSVPLAPSHDGIASPFASLKGTSRPTSIYTRTPFAIIADTDLISTAPRRLILSGVGDLLGKLVAVKDWRLAHKLKGEYYGEYAAQLALLSAKHVLKYHELIGSGSREGLRILVEALISSGVAMCIAGSSRPASGSEHLFSHALDLVAPGRALHGEQVALGTIIMLYIYGDSRWRLVRDVMQRIGLPTTARDLGFSSEEVVKALTIAHTIRPERYTILGETGLTQEAAYRILRETGII